MASMMLVGGLGVSAPAAVGAPDSARSEGISVVIVTGKAPGIRAPGKAFNYKSVNYRFIKSSVDQYFTSHRRRH